MGPLGCMTRKGKAIELNGSATTYHGSAGHDSGVLVQEGEAVSFYPVDLGISH